MAHRLKTGAPCYLSDPPALQYKAKSVTHVLNRKRRCSDRSPPSPFFNSPISNLKFAICRPPAPAPPTRMGAEALSPGPRASVLKIICSDVVRATGTYPG